MGTYTNGATNSSAVDATFDEIRLDSAAMPGPFGSGGADHGCEAAPPLALPAECLTAAWMRGGAAPRAPRWVGVPPPASLHVVLFAVAMQR